MCTIWRNVHILDKCAQFGRVCTIWGRFYYPSHCIWQLPHWHYVNVTGNGHFHRTPITRHWYISTMTHVHLCTAVHWHLPTRAGQPAGILVYIYLWTRRMCLYIVCFCVKVDAQPGWRHGTRSIPGTFTFNFISHPDVPDRDVRGVVVASSGSTRSGISSTMWK